MFANSRRVESRQTGPHPRLDEVVHKHLTAPYLRTPSDAGRSAFAKVLERAAQAPFILDAGCGTGASTFAIARAFPERFVLGIDKSAVRLRPQRLMSESGLRPANAVLLHCDLVDFWQLAVAAGLRCERQYLLYPNPWAKSEHLMRRWHAHPVFPQILALGGEIELRTNWRVYAEEFAQALRLAGIDAEFEDLLIRQTLTPFERKYTASAHCLWRVRAMVRGLSHGC